jgi:hypothetical protein
MGDNDGLARKGLDLGQDARKALCASREPISSLGGIGGLATNEKAMKARGCVRGRQRDGPTSDWNIQQAERKETDRSGDDLSSATWSVPRVLTKAQIFHVGNELDVAEIATKKARNSAVSLDSSHPLGVYLLSGEARPGTCSPTAPPVPGSIFSLASLMPRRLPSIVIMMQVKVFPRLNLPTYLYGEHQCDRL